MDISCVGAVLLTFCKRLRRTTIRIMVIYSPHCEVQITITVITNQGNFVWDKCEDMTYTNQKRNDLVNGNDLIIKAEDKAVVKRDIAS